MAADCGAVAGADLTTQQHGLAIPGVACSMQHAITVADAAAADEHVAIPAVTIVLSTNAVLNRKQIARLIFRVMVLTKPLFQTNQTDAHLIQRFPRL